MEHVEEAGVHSGDSACALPPQTLLPDVITLLEVHTRAIAEALSVVGLLNVQYAVKEGQVYVIEANPRASRTVPFVAKATGVPVAMIAARVMTGSTLAELRTEGLVRPPAGAGWVSVKEAVLPFGRFPGVDTLLGPEMRSTGEVMGVGTTFGLAFAKSQMAAGTPLPIGGDGVPVAGRPGQGGRPRRRPALRRARFHPGGHVGNGRLPRVQRRRRWPRWWPRWVRRGRPTPWTSSPSGCVQLVVNTPRGRGPRADGIHIRSAALAHQVPCLTTVAAARAAAAGMADWRDHGLSVVSLQEVYQ